MQFCFLFASACHAEPIDIYRTRCRLKIFVSFGKYRCDYSFVCRWFKTTACRTFDIDFYLKSAIASTGCWRGQHIDKMAVAASGPSDNSGISQKLDCIDNSPSGDYRHWRNSSELFVNHIYRKSAGALLYCFKHHIPLWRRPQFSRHDIVT